MSFIKNKCLPVAALCGLLALPVDSRAQDYPFRDTTLSIERRVDDLISRLTLEEKVAMMKHEAEAVPRLGVGAYNWWNEALHGVARTNEHVTVFPQAIGLAATFDADGLRRVGDIAATEGRALFNRDMREGRTGGQYRGLTYWTPNINIFRDPRWGRGQETYGEDPYLAARMGTAMVRGLEGPDPEHLKAVACAKHFAVHSGPEPLRHSFDAHASAYDLWDTYLPAFRELVTKAGVHGVMCAYNRLEGAPCCGNNPLMVDILRHQWDFRGYVTSDCWAVNNFVCDHKTHPNDTAAVADALLAGTDLECGYLYPLLKNAVEQGAVSERTVNVSLRRLFTILMKIGFFNPAGSGPYGSIGTDVLECDAHKAHALRMARESMVLLENRRHTLPLNARKIKHIALVGPNADNPKMQLGNYHGEASENITLYKELQRRFGERMRVTCLPAIGYVAPLEEGPSMEQVAREAAKADVIIYVGGISADLEGETGDAGGVEGFVGGDRTSIALPAVQTRMMQLLKATKRPLIVVNMSGCTMDYAWESQHADALIQAWYGGQATGTALADILFGDYNPSGRLPLTAYKSDADLPDFHDYGMQGRTYRYFTGEPRYPFGYGLSYTTFDYSALSCTPVTQTDGEARVSVTVTNSGRVAGDEVVQLYLAHVAQADRPQPLCALKGFRRVHLQPGESTTLTFTLTPDELALTTPRGMTVVQPGEVDIFVGGGQPRHARGITTRMAIEGEPNQVM